MSEKDTEDGSEEKNHQETDNEKGFYKEKDYFGEDYQEKKQESPAEEDYEEKDDTNSYENGGRKSYEEQNYGENDEANNSEAGREESSYEEDGYGKRSYAKYIALVALVIIIIAAGFFLLNSGSGISAQEVAFVSQDDLIFQEDAQNLRGYDWQAFATAGGTEDAKIAALLLLANEVDSLDQDFDFVGRSAGIDKSGFPMQLNASDRSRENIIAMVRSMKTIESIYKEKGLETAQIRLKRLSVLESFFARHGLAQGQIPEEEKELFTTALGFSPADFESLVSLMIANYNVFLAGG